MPTISKLDENLIRRQLSSGGWSFLGSRQVSVEATCLAVLAGGFESERLLGLQRRDGSWPAFSGDTEASWTTALALCVLNAMNDGDSARKRAFQWLLEERGQEADFLWRWKFRIADRNVRFNPELYGWPWDAGSASWVIPTAFSLVAIKQYTACSRPEAAEKRTRLGVGMLLDRVCIGGGWNSGNSIVYGVPLRPHVEATAIALMALQDERRTSSIQTSLEWLKQRSESVESVESLSWSILSLFLYQQPVGQLQAKLATLVGDGRVIRNNATLATAILALKCGEMIHPFAVMR
jgi:hypothetical protein